MADPVIEQYPGAQEKNYTFPAGSASLTVGANLCGNKITNALISRVESSGAWWGVVVKPTGVSDIVQSAYSVPKRLSFRGSLSGVRVSAAVPRQGVAGDGFPVTWRYALGGLSLPDITEEDQDLIFLAVLSGTITVEGQFPTPSLICSTL